MGLRDQRVTSALIGASTADQILENVKAVQQVEFTMDELDKLNRILAKANLPKSLGQTNNTRKKLVR